MASRTKRGMPAAPARADTPEIGAVGLFQAFIDQYGEDAAEATWLAALAMIERAVTLAREGQFGRWRHHPRGELRRLRRDIARGLLLARCAVELQDESNAIYRALTDDLAAVAADAAKARRRAQTLPAQQARLDNARRRREKP